MKTLVSTIKESLDGVSIDYRYDENNRFFIFSLSCESTDVTFIIQIHGDVYVSFMAMLPIIVPEESYADICLLINRINADANISTLFLDPDAYKIYGQSFAVSHNGEIEEDVISLHIGATANAVDSHVKEIFSVLYKSKGE